jgi:hypothetical protein
MKKMISLLALATFAIVFASGCKGFEKCSDAKNADDCAKKEKFEKVADTYSGDNFLCKWEQDPANPNDKTKGECKKGAGAPDYTPTQTETDACNNIVAPADQNACNAADASLSDKAKASYKCVHKPGVGGAANTCKLEKKTT